MNLVKLKEDHNIIVSIAKKARCQINTIMRNVNSPRSLWKLDYISQSTVWLKISPSQDVERRQRLLRLSNGLSQTGQTLLADLALLSALYLARGQVLTALIFTYSQITTRWRVRPIFVTASNAGLVLPFALRWAVTPRRWCNLLCL